MSWSKIRNAFLAVSALLLLAACGFEPLYAPGGNGAVNVSLAGVDVAPIPDRLGQIMHNNLTRSLTSRGENGTTHRLEVELAQSIEGFGYRADEAITRERIRLVAQYRLIDLATGKIVVAESSRADTAIDVLQSDFATLAAEQKAAERNVEQVSAAILSRLALYFRAQAAQAKP